MPAWCIRQSQISGQQQSVLALRVDFPDFLNGNDAPASTAVWTPQATMDRTVDAPCTWTVDAPCTWTVDAPCTWTVDAPRTRSRVLLVHSFEINQNQTE
jgi:hypothetical protein